jgi:shikimate kinase
MTNLTEMEKAVQEALGTRSVVLVGMMGAGKSSIGKRLALKLNLKFIDADTEIETAANRNITEIFEEHGEDYFRDGERRVIARLLENGPQILATGGGAFICQETRDAICQTGISIWLKADIDVLLQRVKRKNTRPLLQKGNPESIMQDLIKERYPIYEKADITVISGDGPHESVVEDIIYALADKLGLVTRQDDPE